MYLVFDLIPQHEEPAQIRPENLDGDTGLGSGKDMVDPVAERLAYRSDHTGDFRQLGTDFFQKFILAAVFQIEFHFDFRTVGGLGMLVQLPAPGPAGSRNHFVDAQQLPFYRIANLVAEVERKPRPGNGRNSQRTFVEIGQETVAEREIDRNRRHQGRGSRPYHYAFMPQSPGKAMTVRSRQFARKPALLLVPRQIVLAPQHHLAEQGSHRHSHQKRHQQGNDICQAKRFQHPTFHARQKEQRRESHDDDKGGVQDGGPDFGRTLKDHLGDRLALFLGQKTVFT